MGESLSKFLSRRPVLIDPKSSRKKLRDVNSFFSFWKKMDSTASDISFIRSRYFAHKNIAERYQMYVKTVISFFKTGYRDSNAVLYHDKTGSFRVTKRHIFFSFFLRRLRIHHETMSSAFPWILMFAVLFTSAALAAFASTSLFTHYGEFFLPQHIQENLSRGELWTNVLSEDPVSGGVGIIVNNVLVTLKAFCYGIVLGIPSIFIAVFNGWHLGSIMAATHKFSMALNLVQFVLNHGILEISIIIFSSAIGMKTGLSFFFVPKGSKLSYFAEEFWKGINSLLIFFMWLFVCGIVESQVSPAMGKRMAHTKAITEALITGLMLFGIYFIIHHGVHLYAGIKNRKR
ncbi:MAG TPA: stage II sporulation protein M [Spirochaetota bacterium]|nr:stage II sporulation protein M [Spirochaetota bacterium]